MLGSLRLENFLFFRFLAHVAGSGFRTIRRFATICFSFIMAHLLVNQRDSLLHGEGWNRGVEGVGWGRKIGSGRGGGGDGA